MGQTYNTESEYINTQLDNITLDRLFGNRLLKKASKPVEWEDLGFAWGKRSGPPTEKVNKSTSQIKFQFSYLFNDL